MWTDTQIWMTALAMAVIAACFILPAIAALSKKKVRIRSAGGTKWRELTVGKPVYFRHAVTGMEGWHYNHVSTTSAIIQEIIDDGTIAIMVRAPEGHFVDVLAKAEDLSYNPTNADMLESMRLKRAGRAVS